MPTIVLADDHQAVRRQVRALLEEEPDFEVIGEAGCGLEAAQIVESSKPDVLVLDLVMGDMNGFEVTRLLAKKSPATGIVIYSMYGSEAYVSAALQAGARAYVLKGSSSAELVHAIREVAAGNFYMPGSLSRDVIKKSLEKSDGAE